MQTHPSQADLNFDLGEQKELLRQEIRKLVARECPREYVREMDERETLSVVQRGPLLMTH
jgi:hypothetical protein